LPKAPEWSPNGDAIAFASNPTGNYDIWILSLESSEMWQVTDEPVDEYGPTWAPTGDALAFVRVLNDVRDLFAIYFER
jgi:Tol biopolymer transport system component